jgi:hypothetical protein
VRRPRRRAGRPRPTAGRSAPPGRGRRTGPAGRRRGGAARRQVGVAPAGRVQQGGEPFRLFGAGGAALRQLGPLAFEVADGAARLVQSRFDLGHPALQPGDPRGRGVDGRDGGLPLRDERPRGLLGEPVGGLRRGGPALGEGRDVALCGGTGAACGLGGRLGALLVLGGGAVRAARGGVRVLGRPAHRARVPVGQPGGEFGGHPRDARPAHLVEGVHGRLGGVDGRHAAPLGGRQLAADPGVGLGGAVPPTGGLQRLGGVLARARPAARLREFGGGPLALGGQLLGAAAGALQGGADGGQAALDLGDLAQDGAAPVGIAAQVLQPGDLVAAPPLGGPQPDGLGGPQGVLPSGGVVG